VVRSNIGVRKENLATSVILRKHQCLNHFRLSNVSVRISIHTYTLFHDNVSAISLRRGVS
jgi:hypothetical protein